MNSDYIIKNLEAKYLANLFDYYNNQYSKEGLERVVVIALHYYKYTLKYDSKNQKKKNSPAVVVCGEYGGIFKCGKSGHGITSFYEPLNSAIDTLRKHPIPSCYNKPGNCAENHAANKILGKTGSVNIEHFDFSISIRPRDFYIIPICDNCKKVFNK